ncbi:hypothetical protein TSAR_011601 [Trichomalopsis sarcophagae]|uniref:Uncharacterized protein n=1 Tax=Trichomalopsis sarcophagae TaxID=543379 RepID=A0A232EXL4_9HYME|nr:hypothetical protein TSAR_011601 [Trichomalopsis sarcophagae]
MYLDSKHN